MKRTNAMIQAMNQYRQKFYSVYHTLIVPIFKNFERERKSRLQDIYVLSAVLIIISIMLLLDVYNTGFAGDGNYSIFWLNVKVVIAIFCIVAIVCLPLYHNKKFVTKLKNSCMGDLLKLFGKMQWFEDIHVITDDELVKSNLFSIFNRRSSDDGFIGEYKGVPFEISETSMEHVTGSGKNRRVEQVFKGVVVKYKFNRLIGSQTIVATKGDHKIRGGWSISCWSIIVYLTCEIIMNACKNGFSLEWIIMWLFGIGIVTLIYLAPIGWSKINGAVNMSEVKLEDPEFSKKYKVYSYDQVEARYLITPAFMDRFKNIETCFGTHNVKCSFYGDCFMIAISTNKNLFEIGNLFKSLEDPKQLENFFNELTSIFMLVDYFKLDESPVL